MKTSEASPPAMQPAAWRGRDGRLWFTTQKGIVVVDPNRLAHNGLTPPVVIEEVVANGETFVPGEGVTIPPGKDRIEIHYTGLSLSIPAKVQFRYKLQGYDPGLGRRRDAARGLLHQPAARQIPVPGDGLE